MPGASKLREGYARVLGCAVDDVALTTSTSEGIGAVMAGTKIGKDTAEIEALRRDGIV